MQFNIIDGAFSDISVRRDKIRNWQSQYAKKN